MSKRLYPIKGFEELYAVTKSGKIWSHTRQIFLTPVKKKQRFVVFLSSKYKKKWFRIDKLVADTFIPNHKRYINHKNKDLLDCRLCNLDCSNINIHRKIGSGSNNVKLTKKDVIKIKKLLKNYYPKYISNLYNISERSIYNIKTGKTWRWL